MKAGGRGAEEGNPGSVDRMKEASEGGGKSWYVFCWVEGR